MTMFGVRLAVKSARSCVFNYAQRAQSLPVSSSLLLSRQPRRHTSQAFSAANLDAQSAADAASPANLPPTHVSSDGGDAPRSIRKLKTKPAKDLTGGNPRYEDVTFSRTTLSFRWKGRQHRYLNVWLRDTCRCTQCVNQETMQRNFNITDLPDPSSLVISEVMIETEGIRILWNVDDHESFYDWALIERYMNKRKGPEPDPSLRQFWGSDISKDPPTVNYEEVMDSGSDRGMAKLTDHLVRYGLVFVCETPFDDAVHTKKLLERIGPIRETHYGGFYDFVPDMAKADTAYTNIALAAHTDTTYFTEPAGLQAFHMLSHTMSSEGSEETQPSGGKSLLVDGFRAAEQLQKEDLGLFKRLAREKLAWHASGNQGITITPDTAHPVIKCGTGQMSNRPQQIRWNNDDRGVFGFHSEGYADVRQRKRVREWYSAAAKWNQILKRESSEFWFQLRPGLTLIFDNHRVLHGRSAFTGMRRICGGYINRDDFLSRWRNTNLPRQEVVAQVIGC